MSGPALQTQRKVLASMWAYEVDPPMSLTKRVALFEDFPWLEKYVDLEEVERVYVSRVGNDLLLYKPLFSLFPLFSFSFDWTEDVFFLNREGDKLGSVSRGETVETALAKLSEHTVRSISYVYSYSERTRSVIVYRIPKNLSMFEWLGVLKQNFRTENQDMVAA